MFIQKVHNGLQVVLDPRPLGESGVYLSFDRGAFHQDKAEVAHLLEHLQGVACGVYGASHPLRYASANAQTSAEHTAYYFTNILPEDVKTALAYLVRVFNPVQGDVLDRERAAVRHELAPHMNPGSALERRFLEALFPEHMKHLPTIEERLNTLKSLTLEDAREFRNKFYRPANAVLCVSGEIPSDIERMIEPYTRLPAQEKISVREWPTETPPKGRAEMIDRFRQDNMMSIGIAYPTIPFKPQEHREALAAGILRYYLNSTTGPLHRRLRQARELCYGANISYREIGNAAVNMIFTESSNLDATKAIEEEVSQIIEGVQRDGIPDDILDIARKKLKIEELHSSREFGIGQVLCELKAGKSAETSIEILEKMNVADIIGAAKRMFGQDYLVSIALPK